MRAAPREGGTVSARGIFFPNDKCPQKMPFPSKNVLPDSTCPPLGGGAQRPRSRPRVAAGCVRLGAGHAPERTRHVRVPVPPAGRGARRGGQGRRVPAPGRSPTVAVCARGSVRMKRSLARTLSLPPSACPAYPSPCACQVHLCTLNSGRLYTNVVKPFY